MKTRSGNKTKLYDMTTATVLMLFAVFIWLMAGLAQVDSFPFGFGGRVNVPVPSGGINQHITPVGLCCEFDDCTICEPEFGVFPTLEALPTFIGATDPALPTVPTVVPTPVREIPTRIPTPVNQPPPTADTNPARATPFVLTPVAGGIDLDAEPAPAIPSEISSSCFAFPNVDCGPFWGRPGGTPGGPF